MFSLPFETPLSLGRLALPVILLLALPKLGAQEAAIVSLKEFVSTEVRAQGFTLPQATKVHVYARGGGSNPFGSDHSNRFAYGWILNATTREVVWQMDHGNSRRENTYLISDQYLDLPPGSYEAYFSNHGFARNTLFSHWNSNIDRREIPADLDRRSNEPRGFLSLFGMDRRAQLRIWKERAKNYGLELSVPASTAPQVQTFQAPLRWKNIVASSSNLGDKGHWEQAFEVRKPVKLHVYGIGEGARSAMHDYGWITDVRSRKRVWEMNADKAQYAGGASKNLRQVETLQLPAGRYVATYITDDSHSSADWNAAPPCDPLLTGLTLAVADDTERSAVVLTERRPAGSALAELIRVQDEKDLSAAFTLKAGQDVAIYAIGEGHSGRMADYAWIDDASGKRVWTMESRDTHHAGGAQKNRLADVRITLPKGTYTVHFHTDDSHAYGDWNADAPMDPERYGVTVRSLSE